MKPLVTIVIPNYNSAKFIEETLNSVCKQGYQNWEALVVDDGSSDNSPQIIKQKCNTESRIRYIQRDRDPKGGNVCRNIGLQEAKGKYIIFLDSDDLLSPDCLEQRVCCMEANTFFNVGVFNMVSFTNTPKDGSLYSRLKAPNPLIHFLVLDVLWQTTAPIWDSDFLRSIGGFNENFQRAQDPELIVRAFLNKNIRYKLFLDSKPDFFYRKGIKKDMSMHLKRYDAYFGFLELNMPHIENIESLKLKALVARIWQIRILSIAAINQKNFPDDYVKKLNSYCYNSCLSNIIQSEFLYKNCSKIMRKLNLHNFVFSVSFRLCRALTKKFDKY